MLRMSIGVMLPEIAKEFSLSELQSGAFISLLFVGMTVTMGFAGYVSDRLGRITASTAGFCLMLIGILSSGYSNSFLTASISIFVTGLGVGVFTPSVYAAIGEVLPKSRGFMVGAANAAYAVGGFLGPILAGIILSYFNWRAQFYIFGLLAVPILIGLWFSGGKISPNTVIGQKTIREAPRILKMRSLLIASAALFSANIGFGSFTSWAPTFLSSVNGLDVTQIGFTVGIWALMGGAGAIVLGWLSDRASRIAVSFASGISAAVLAYFYFASVNSFLVIIELSAAFGFMAYAYYSLLTSIAQDAVDPASIGSATGVVQNLSITGSIIGPVVAATSISFLGVKLGMICSVSIPYLAQAFLVLASRTKPVH